MRQEFGLTEFKWNTPFLEDTDFYNDYRIWSFPDYNPRSEGKSFGGAICKANEVIWKRIRKGSYSPTDIKETLSHVEIFGLISVSTFFKPSYGRKAKSAEDRLQGEMVRLARFLMDTIDRHRLFSKSCLLTV